MKNGPTRARRGFVPVGVDFLDDRLLLSAIGRPTLPPARDSAYARPAAVQVGRAEALPAARAGSHVACHPAGSAVVQAPTVRRWSWLADTYWYVPTRNLPAVLYDSTTGSLLPVSDQTVFQITGYREGYFWGKTVTQLGSSSASPSNMVGSVTPQGRVLLTFTTTSANSAPLVTEGFGEMTRKSGQWTMENQMFTSPNETLRLGHWAYMVQTRPGMPSWNSLPGVDESVPTFLGQDTEST
jgi:hypothetical protein